MSEKSNIGADLKKLALYIMRVRLVIFIVGAIFALLGQSFVGFWEFRENNQKFLQTEYANFLSHHRQFEHKIGNYNKVFNNRKYVEREYGNFGDSATNYISILRSFSQLLPETESELAPYVSSISNLNKYYSTNIPPKTGSVDWVIFYGSFRKDYDSFNKSKDVFMSAVQEQMTDYGRYVLNPGS